MAVQKTKPPSTYCWKKPKKRLWKKVAYRCPLGLLITPPHARGDEASKPINDAASPHASSKRAAQRREVNHQLLNRTEPLWDPNATTNAPPTKRGRREAERLASLELQFRSFPLQRISTPPHVAAICRPFLRAGWTIKDILHAIDWRPNTDAKYHHDGANGVENTGAWLAFRLGKWVRHDGDFYRSPPAKNARPNASRKSRNVGRPSNAGNANWQNVPSSCLRP